MAQQIKKKYLKDGSVDGSKIKILSGQSIVAENASSQLVELLKINASNKVEAVGQEISYKSELDQEVSDRQSGDSQNAAGLAQEILDRQAGDDDLRSDLDQEVLDRQSAVSAEQSRAEGEENLLKSRVTTAEGDIDSLEGRMMTAEGNISNEVSRAQSEETLIKSRVTTAEGDIDSLESRMMTAESNISNEVSRAEGEENLLKGRMTTAEGDIDSLESRMMSAESNISNEVSRAEGEENLLKGRMTTAEGDIDSLESRMMSAEGNISNEVSRATSEENLLKGRMTTAEGDIDSLESRMMSAESGLSTETADRIAGDANLQSQIDNVLSNIDPVALDSLTEVVAAFQSADSDLTAAITALGTSAQSALAQEILDRQSDVDAEETRAMGVEASLQSQITQEISDRQSAVSSEQSRAEGVEAGLQSAINTEVSDRQTAVSAEQSRAEGVETGLQSAIDAEVLARQDAVSSEETRAMAAEGELQSSVDTEEFNRIVADNALQSNIDSESSARQAEDLTFFKHDGSRPMTGDLFMMNDVSGLGNDIKWQMINEGESVNSIIQWGMITSSYYNNNSYTNVITSKNFAVGVESPLIFTSAQSNLFAEGQFVEQNYDKSGSYGLEGLSFSHFAAEVLDESENVISSEIDYSVSLQHDGLTLNNGPFSAEYKISQLGLNGGNGYNTGLNNQGFGSFSKGFFANDEYNQTVIDGCEISTRSVMLYDKEIGTPFVPTDAAHATTKQYVDQQVSDALDTGSSNLVEAKAYADQKVADLVNSAPEVLDTLKELSDALGGDANFAASVASTIGDVSSRVSVVESIANGKHKVVLSSTDISNGYIDLPHNARVESMMGFVDRLAIHNEEDYEVSVVGGVTRITFIGELVSPSEQALVAGDTIFFRYEFYSA